MEHLEGILSRLAQSQEKTQVSQETTQRQVETILETVSALVTKRNKNTQEGESSVTNDTNSDPNQAPDDIMIHRRDPESEDDTSDHYKGLDKGTSPIQDFFPNPSGSFSIWSELPELRVFAETGDWDSAKLLFRYYPEAVSAAVTEDLHTALHIAVSARQWKFVLKLIEEMQPADLELQDTKYGYTALHTVVVEGNVEVAMAMVNKNRKLTQIPEYNGSVPLKVAADYVTDRQEEMVRYLLPVTLDEEPGKPFSGPRGASLLCSLIEANLYDIALCVVQKYPKLGIEKSEKTKVTALEVMARIAFLSGCRQSWINSGHAVTKMHNLQLMNEKATDLVKYMLTQLRETTGHMEFFETSDVLRKAMKAGTTEFVVECLQTFPELIWHKTRNQRILQVAVEERNHEVLNLICHLSGDHKNDLVSKRDDNGNTILHSAAKLVSSHQLKLVSGAPLQMQRETNWFKEVKNLLPEKDRLVRNKDGETAQQIFTKEHMQLVKEAEKWMKLTSQSCILVATLIAIVAFSAAFTFPGGSKSDTGIPIFLFRNAFMVFAMADALALFSSITSILMFLSILTSRYAEEDFLKSLPSKLIIGLATLWFSLASLMTAFGAALAMVLGHRLSGVTIVVAMFALVPVYSFAHVQFPLFIEIVRSTYWPIIFTRNKQRSFKKE